jgi:hypothetical protein
MIIEQEIIATCWRCSSRLNGKQLVVGAISNVPPSMLWPYPLHIAIDPCAVCIKEAEEGGNDETSHGAKS